MDGLIKEKDCSCIVVDWTSRSVKHCILLHSFLLKYYLLGTCLSMH